MKLKLEENSLKDKPRLFIDMDGTIAEWRNIKIEIDSEEKLLNISEELDKVLYLERYFRTLKPYENVLEGLKIFQQNYSAEIYILSCVKKDKGNSTPLKDKNEWIEEYFPEINEEHRIFVPDGENKVKYIPNGIKDNDYLLDDYSKNLHDWEKAGGTGIKLLNNVNENKGTWNGNKISYNAISKAIEMGLYGIIYEEKEIRHFSPDKDTNKIPHNEFIENYKDLYELD